MDYEKLEAGFKLVLEGLGLDAHNPHLKQTPQRTAEAWRDELCAGLKNEPFSLDVFPVDEGMETELVALNRIPVKSICAHHLLPFHGEATVGYIPRERLCGLSKLSRVVDHFARRPQLQEHLTTQIAQFLERELAAEGVGVVIRASHYCMEFRGVNHPGTMTTRALLGRLKEDPTLRGEFMSLAETS